MFYVYVLYSPDFDKTYTGYTSNLEGRLLAHNHPSNKGYTSKYQPWIIAFSETFSTKNEALQKESWLKTGAGRAFLANFLKRNS